jgi:adenosylhomocysteine nucleosidase
VTAKTALIILSAEAEWQIATAYYPDCRPQDSPFSSWFELYLNGNHAVFFHGGWGKVSAAAAAQYAIDRWRPDLLVNLGTCGGFSGCIQPDEIVLAEETLIYDIYERMGSAQEALDFYTTRIDLSYLKEPLPLAIRRARLISADRDIDPAEVAFLREQFHACAADWESGAIAWVAARNGLRCLILRGVSDLVDEKGGEAYGNFELFRRRTREVMYKLLASLPEWLERAL